MEGVKSESWLGKKTTATRRTEAGADQLFGAAKGALSLPVIIWRYWAGVMAI